MASVGIHGTLGTDRNLVGFAVGGDLLVVMHLAVSNPGRG